MQHSAPSTRVMTARRTRDHRPAIQENARLGTGPDSKIRRRKAFMCYKRKMKCEFEGSSKACIQCLRRNLKCKTLSGKGKRDNNTRSLYARTLEERLRRTESLLRSAGVVVEHTDLGTMSDISDGSCEDDSAMEDEDDTVLTHPDGSTGGKTEDFKHSIDGVPAERMSPTRGVTSKSTRSNPQPNSLERSRSNARKSGPPVYKPDKGCYLGRSTPLSILSREGLEWIKSRSGEESSLSSLLSGSRFDSPWAYWRPDVFYDLFSSRVFKPLPPRAEVFSLLGDYFRTVNLIFPLYHEATFMQLVEWQYTQQTCDDAARWAGINIILALAYEYRFSNSQKSEKDREKAWLYYKNALSVFPELVLRRTDLLSVQALLGMALFLRGNSGSQSTVPIVTAAIRSSHRMGLHRDIPRPYLSQIEQEQRRNVFWIAYILDQSIAIRLGSAPTQHFDDFDVQIPSDETTAGLMMADNKAFFPRVCRLAVIRSQIYRQFYSARALEDKPTAEICEMIHKLHAELESWKNGSRFDILFRHRGTGEDFLSGLASAGLFLLYYNSLIMIHRLPMLVNFVYQTRPDSIPEIDIRLILNQCSTSAAVCVQAARDSLRLVNNLPWGDVAWISSLLYFVFLAVMMIFANILRNSQQPTAKDDLQSLNMAATFFATLVPGDGPCNYARFMTRMSTTFEHIARTVLERDQKILRLSADRKRGPSKSSRTAHNTRPDSHSEPQSQSTTRSNHSASTDIHIPNLDGLPPINACGYVVRESPTTAPSPNETITPQNNPTTPSNSIQESRQHSNFPNVAQFQPQAQAQQQRPYTTENINMAFALPALDESNFTFTQPDLWQIPLTADWEFGFGGQFLGSVFGNPGAGNEDGNCGDGHGLDYLFQGTNCPESAPTATTIPGSSISMMSGTGAECYGCPNGSAGTGNGVQGTTAPPNPTKMWMDGHYGGPY
ncbi:transcription factor domain-containing protein [Aspergillus lucknowensis]|uniref:Fungal-specific transcription factor domain-containing protein n=1 Tax=Aspergillus lucknowensis TaxID=176173 RepID=A0ABR4LH19_9EURO